MRPPVIVASLVRWQASTSPARVLASVASTVPRATSCSTTGIGAGRLSHQPAASTAASAPGGSANAVALADVWKTPLSGGRTAAETYADMVGGIGQRKAAIAQAVETQEAIKDQITAMRESISGVSLDEEMVSLTKYQRAYEAAGRVLTTVDELLQDLINRVGR